MFSFFTLEKKLDKADLKETLSLLFEHQHVLNKKLALLNQKINNSHEVTQTENKGCFLHAVFCFILLQYLCDFLHIQNAKYERGELIGFDINRNGKINEPEDFDLIAKYNTVMLIVTLSTILLLICKGITFSNITDSISKIQARLNQHIVDLDKNIENLSETQRSELPSLDEFICPISLSLIKNPIQVFVKNAYSVYDYEWFMQYAKERLINNFELRDPRTTLEIEKVCFSNEINKNFQKLLIDLHGKVSKFKLENECFALTS